MALQHRHALVTIPHKRATMRKVLGSVWFCILHFDLSQARKMGGLANELRSQVNAALH